MSERKQFYVTTPIYYVNDVPHLGHAYTTVAADAIARYQRRLLGDENVFFLTGTDEHGAKVAAAAEKAGKAPQAFVDEVSAKYVETWQLLNISYDSFFRTTDPHHKAVVHEVLQKIYDKGLIYKGMYKGIYCIGCEKYLSEDEIVDGHCIHHPSTQLVEQEEENYFLKLSELAPQVLAALERGDYRVLPEGRRAEIVGKMTAGISDISISRQGATWGIPVPWDSDHTIYVWVEALMNYYSATRFEEGLNRFWPASLQLMAKDILWFHALVWEAILIAAELPLPEAVFAHGFFTVDGQKMSKSVGNVIDPVEMVQQYGADAFRYLLLTAFTFGNDGDLSLTRFKEKYNADLANGIGNLISRVANLAEKAGFEVSNGKPAKPFTDDVAAAMEACKPDEALKAVWTLVSDLDKVIHDEEPWKLQGEELHKALSRYISQLGEIGSNVSPFMPSLSQAIDAIFFSGPIRKPEPLFLRK